MMRVVRKIGGRGPEFSVGLESMFIHISDLSVVSPEAMYIGSKHPWRSGKILNALRDP